MPRYTFARACNCLNPAQSAHSPFPQICVRSVLCVLVCVCFVNYFPKAGLSVFINDLDRFEWPPQEKSVNYSTPGINTGKADTNRASPIDTAARYRPTDGPQRAGLAAYLNAVLRPGRKNEWVIAATGDACGAADFLSVPLGCWKRSPLDRGQRRRGVVRGDAPSAAICLSEAVKNGTPSSGLRVLLEIIRPLEAAREVTTSPGGPDCAEQSKPSCGGGAGAGGQEALYRAIAVLVAANTRSPSTRPVVVLTDLQDVWKLLWLGEGRSVSDGSRKREGRENIAEAAMEEILTGEPLRMPQSPKAQPPYFAANGDDIDAEKDVFVWRMKAAEAVSIVRSMLRDETSDWDGEVSWSTRPRVVVRAAAAVTNRQFEGHDYPVNGGRGGAGDGSGGGSCGGNPMAVFRDRHLAGCRRLRQRSTHNGGHCGGGDTGGSGFRSGVGESTPPILRTTSPPAAMELALRQGWWPSNTRKSFPGQDAGEHREGEGVHSSFGNDGNSSFAHNGNGSVSSFFRGTYRRTTPNGHANGYHANGHDTNALHSNGHHANDYLPTPPNNGQGVIVGCSTEGDSIGCHRSSNSSRGLELSSSLSRPPPPPPTTSPLAGGGGDPPTILRNLVSFASGEGFLYVAGVSKKWRDAWGVERPPETSIDAAVQSPSRLRWARASGCAWGWAVCARAAAGAHLATLHYARAIGCPWDWRTCAHAATEVILLQYN